MLPIQSGLGFGSPQVQRWLVASHQPWGWERRWERLLVAPTSPPIWKRVKSSMELGKGAKRLLES